MGDVNFIELLIENYVYVVIATMLIILIIVGIVYRKQLKRKIQQETISFTALVISLTLTIIGFLTKQQTEVTTLTYINGKEVSLFLPITTISIILVVVFLIIFFRKELAKDISFK